MLTGIEATYVWVDDVDNANKAYIRTEWGGRMGTGSHDSGAIEVLAARLGTGAAINDLWVNVYNSTGHLVMNGYTPLYVPIKTDGTYHIDYSNYGPYYFTNSNTTSNYYVANWGGGRVTIDVKNYARVHGFYYDNDNPGTYVKMTYGAKDLSGNAISGMYGGFKNINGNVETQGYTPYTVGVKKNFYLEAIWNNYGAHVYQRADLVPNSGFEEGSDTTTAWGGTQDLSLTGTGPYVDTGRFTP